MEIITNMSTFFAGIMVSNRYLTRKGAGNCKSIFTSIRKLSPKISSKKTRKNERSRT